jgi:hypothetical protein
MKNKILPFIIGCLAYVGNSFAQPQVWSQNIQSSNTDFSGGLVAVGQVVINAPSAGKVVVRFDGFATITPGDRMIFAASDKVGYGINEGHVSIEVPDTDVNKKSFSHTMSYNVVAGLDTFYAVVGQSAVEPDGTGVGSVYGHISVEFFPTADNAMLQVVPIVSSSTNLRGAPVVLGRSIVNFPSDGKVVVRFDGMCLADTGDRVIMAASNIPNWGTNDGSVSVEAYTLDENRNPFSHTRVYDVVAGLDTFYAVAENYVEEDGSGIASIYGHLTVEYFPNGGTTDVEFETVAQSASLEGAAVTLATINFNAPVDGVVLLTFDGRISSSVGDRVILAASNTQSWYPNDGAVGLEAYSTDLDRNSFSHSRTYSVTAGANSFYGVGENYVETDGSGSATIYASLTMKFFANPSTAVDEVAKDEIFAVFPNPATENVFITFDEPSNSEIKLFDLAGRVVVTTQTIDSKLVSISLSTLPKGLYFLQVGNKVQKVVKE